MLPEAVLALPERGAVNFHDGPLPAYAGLNAPVWAMLDGQTRHGITWHLMEATADSGDVVARAAFEITGGDTTLTLNTKAYEAAIASFGEVLEKLALDDVPVEAQPAEGRSYYGRDKRPAAAGADQFRPGRSGGGADGAGTGSRALLEPAGDAEDRGRWTGSAGCPGGGIAGPGLGRGAGDGAGG